MRVFLTKMSTILQNEAFSAVLVVICLVIILSVVQ
jgi:hypothetical protein